MGMGLHSCWHGVPGLEGHYLGDPLRRANMLELAGPLMTACTLQPGASLAERASCLGNLLLLVGKTAVDKSLRLRDPVEKARRKLQAQNAGLDTLEKEIDEEIALVVRTVTKGT